jgi:hypothetical protein
MKHEVPIKGIVSLIANSDKRNGESEKRDSERSESVQ